jgi:hypothetical protein
MLRFDVARVKASVDQISEIRLSWPMGAENAIRRPGHVYAGIFPAWESDAATQGT